MHSYHGKEYLKTETFPSVTECARELRRRGYHFKKMRICGLDDDSEVLKKGDDWVEVEEMRREDHWLFIEGKPCLPLSDWAKRHGTTNRVARYGFTKGKLPGYKVGKGNFLYLEDEEDKDGK